MIVWWINFVTKSWRSEDHSCFKTITHFEIGYNNTLLVERSNELRCFYSKLLSLRFPLQERAAVEYGGDEILPPVLGALTSLSPRAWRCSDSSPTEMPYLCVISFWPKGGILWEADERLVSDREWTKLDINDLNATVKTKENFKLVRIDTALSIK